MLIPIRVWPHGAAQPHRSVWVRWSHQDHPPYYNGTALGCYCCAFVTGTSLCDGVPVGVDFLVVCDIVLLTCLVCLVSTWFWSRKMLVKNHLELPMGLYKCVWQLPEASVPQSLGTTLPPHYRNTLIQLNIHQFSSLFAVSTRNNLLGGHLWTLVLVIISFGGIWQSTTLARIAKRKA